MAKKKKEKNNRVGAAAAKVRAKPSAKRVADRKVNVKARAKKGSATYGSVRARGTGK